MPLASRLKLEAGSRLVGLVTAELNVLFIVVLVAAGATRVPHNRASRANPLY